MALIYSHEAKEQIRTLHPETKQGIKAVLEGLVENPHSGKPLQRELIGFWSIDYKRYRAIYQPQQNGDIQIHVIGHRTEIYNDFLRMESQPPTKSS